jgi:putative flippase GtrA
VSVLRRLVAYSLGSVVAATCGEVAFVAVYGWLAAGNVAASAAGFVGGAIPNYVVNRRWVWGDRRGRRPRNELLLYWGTALASFATSVGVTGLAEGWARSLATTHAWRVALVAVAYLAVAGVFFVVKFAVFHVLVFTPAASAAPPTTS